jgi:hypothetical protein
MRYCSASLMCDVVTYSEDSKSAIVLATRKIFRYPRADKSNLAVALSSKHFAEYVGYLLH